MCPHYFTVIFSHYHPGPSVSVDKKTQVVIVGNSVYSAAQFNPDFFIFSLDFDVSPAAWTTTNVTTFDLPARLQAIDVRRSLIQRLSQRSLIDYRLLDCQPSSMLSSPSFAPFRPAAEDKVFRDCELNSTPCPCLVPADDVTTHRLRLFFNDLRMTSPVLSCEGQCMDVAGHHFELPLYAT